APSLRGYRRRDLAPLAEPAQGVSLELADALAGDAEDPPDLLGRLRFVPTVQPVAQRQDALLTLRQLGDRAVECLLGEIDLYLLVRLGLVAREQIAERRGVAL